MFVDNAQQCLAFTPQANFPVHDLNSSLKVKMMGLNPGYLLKSFLLYMVLFQDVVFFFTDSNLNVLLRISKFLLCNNWCVVVKVQHNYVILHSLQGQFLLGLSI